MFRNLDMRKKIDLRAMFREMRKRRDGPYRGLDCPPNAHYIVLFFHTVLRLACKIIGYFISENIPLPDSSA